METGELFQACRLCLNRAVLGSHPHPSTAGSCPASGTSTEGLCNALDKTDQNLHMEAKRVKAPRSLKAVGARAHLHVVFYPLGFSCSHGPPQLLSGLFLQGRVATFSQQPVPLGTSNLEL